MGYKLIYTKQAAKDAKKLEHKGLDKKTIKLLKLIKKKPFATPPYFEKLSGDLSGAYSRRINVKHRLVYQVYKESNC